MFVFLSVWHDIIACRAILVRFFADANNPFTLRRDSYSLFPVDDALSIPVTFFDKSMLRFMQIFIPRTKNSWCPFAGIELWSHWKQFTKSMLYLSASPPRRLTDL